MRPLLQRLLALASSSAVPLRKPAAGCRRSSPACRCPPAPGSTARSFLLARAGAALAVYGGVGARPRRARRGHRRARRRPARSRCSSPSSSTAGPTALSVLFPDGDPLYRKLRPRSRCRRRPAFRSPRTAGSAGTVTAAALAKLHGEGKVAVMPASATPTPNQSHFTSRHFWEVGATSEQLRTGWLGRYLDRVGTPDNPLQGLSLDWRLAAGARHREACPSPRSTAPTSTASGRATSGATSRSGCSTRSARSARLPTNGDAGARAGGQRRAPVGTAAPAAAPFTPRTTSPASRAPSRTRRRRRVSPPAAGLAAMLGAGLPVRVVALSAPGMYDTHDDQAAGARRRPQADRRQPAGVPARPGGARHRRPRRRPRLVGVRPPRRRRTARTEPTTAPPAPAS